MQSKFGIFAIAAGLLLVACRGYAAAPAAISVECSDVRPASMPLGAPVAVDYTIQNRSHDPVMVDMGLDGAIGGREWLTMTLISDTSGPVGLWPTLPTDSGGLHCDSVRLDPGAKHSGRLLISRFFDIRVPGRYTFTVHTRLKVLPVDSMSVSPTPSMDDETFTRTFVMTAPDIARLGDLGREYADAALADHTPAGAAALDALATMPAPVALSEWRRLLQNESTRRSLLAALAERPSPMTVDFLANTAWPQGDSGNGDRDAVASLGLAYLLSYGDLRQRISTLFTQHDVSLQKYTTLLHNGG